MMKIGIIGTGFIAEAMVDGFLSKGSNGLSFALSPRGAEVAARIASRHPDCVLIASSSQAVLDASDLVILSVRPQGAAEIVKALKFQPRHRVVSVVAGYSQAAIAAMVAPADRVILAIPLPAMARGSGPTVIMPPDHEVSELFARAGIAIEIDDEHAYAAMGTATAIMAPYFALARTVTDWLSRQGVGEDSARLYVGQLLSGLAETSNKNPKRDFGALESAHATPGSFNDYLRTHLQDKGAYAALDSGLDILLKRMKGA
jgi:pyrroline-5-carboxylate reductase